MATSDSWSPDQYDRFQAARSQPFYDLAALLQPSPRPRVLDLGCGSGRLTAWLHHHLGARETLGIDTSAAMLAQARGHEAAGLRFAQADIAGFEPDAPLDVVFSNAALHWLPDHPSLFARLRGFLAAEGQLAVQMPANADHPSHRVADEIAQQPRFADALAGIARPTLLSAPERYVELLAGLGFGEPRVRIQVYTHELDSSADVVEWVKGTLLTPYRRRLSAPLYEAFLDAYHTTLLAEIGEQSPYLYRFKRLLIWARLPA